MDEARIAQLMAIRNIVDAMLAGETVGFEPDSVSEAPINPGDCKHKNIQEVGGLGGSQERTVCVDCKQEI